MNLALKDKPKKKNIGFLYAKQGIVEIVKKEHNFQIHLFAGIITVLFSFIVKLSYIEWAIIILTMSSVFITEMINSVVERIIDYVKPEYHIQAKIIKDVAAGAVLVSALTAVIIGLLIFIPKIVELVN